MRIDRLKALLESNCLTYTEIGKRLSFSRERIRQLAMELGYPTGRHRRRVCVLSRLVISKKVNDAIQEAARNGVVLFPVLKRGNPLQYNTRKAKTAGGKLVRVGAVEGIGPYYKVRFQNLHEIAWIGKAPDGSWFIIPGEQSNGGFIETLFSPIPSQNGIGQRLNARHDWLSFRNNWEPLKGEEHEGEARGIGVGPPHRGIV